MCLTFQPPTATIRQFGPNTRLRVARAMRPPKMETMANSSGQALGRLRRLESGFQAFTEIRVVVGINRRRVRELVMLIGYPHDQYDHKTGNLRTSTPATVKAYIRTVKMWPAPSTTLQIRFPPSPLGLIGTHVREEVSEAVEVIELAEIGGDLQWDGGASGTSDSAFANSALFCTKAFPREQHKT